MDKIRALPRPAPRISHKLRSAIDLRVRKGMTILDACTEAGLSTAGWHKAMKRPAVKDHLQKVQGAYVSEVSANQAVYKAQALDVAFDLMMNAKSESVRARMAEFLASDGKTPQVSVHVDARHGPSGYEYARPGQKIVQIVDSDDGNPDQGTTRPAVGGIAAPD